MGAHQVAHGIHIRSSCSAPVSMRVLTCSQSSVNIRTSRRILLAHCALCTYEPGGAAQLAASECARS